MKIVSRRNSSGEHDRHDRLLKVGFEALARLVVDLADCADGMRSANDPAVDRARPGSRPAGPGLRTTVRATGGSRGTLILPNP